MRARPGRGPGVGAGLALAVLTAGLPPATFPAATGVSVTLRRHSALDQARVAAPLRAAVRPPGWPRSAAPARPSAGPGVPDVAAPGFLIYLIDGGDPIVVARYVEERGQIVFEKYGGWVRIPTYEVLKIVPDTPDPGDRTANLPPPPSPETGGAPLRLESDLYVTLHGGNQLRVSSLTPDGERVRVGLSNGSFTVARSEIVSVVRVPTGSEVAEAWLSIRTTDLEDPAGGGSAGLLPTPPAEPRLPYASSERPHVVRLADGQLMRVDAFWVEEGEFRFRRLGGVVGIALSEIARLFPEDIAPVRGRTPVRFVRRLGPDLVEVGVRSGRHRVRLVGIEPVDGKETAESPWRLLEPGLIVYLEFDRQRYDAEGDWLAYVFLPNGRMLNAELIRLGLARPVGDGANARYLDLFHEMTEPAPASDHPE